MQYLLSLLLVFTIWSINPSSSYGQVKFGVKTGMNISTTKNLSTFPRNRIGNYSGAFIIVPLKSKYSLRSELFYNSKGYKFLYHYDSSIDLRNNIAFNFLSLPVLIEFKIDSKTSLLGGIELGRLLIVTQKINKEKFDISKSFPSKMEVALNIGIDYKIYRQLGCEARYSYGFKTFYWADSRGNYDTKKGGFRVFQLGTNFTF